METKRDIRKQMLCARDRLTDREWETYSDRITEQVVSHPLFVQAKEIWCYVSMGKEVCTEQILVSAWRAGKRTAVPKVTGKREMKFYYIESLNDLETGAFGILEPKEEKKGADCCLEKSDLLMLVPGVSFDPAGRRIGYGGGFYDTYLQKMEGCHTFGLAFEVQMADQIPAEAHDIRMEYVMTEKEVLEMLTGLPKDPILLLSVVNTKLRDYYPSLDALCDDMDVSREVLEEKLGMIDYRYDAEKNQFE